MLLFISRESIREIIEDAGSEIWYLPAYCPDLNKRCDPAAGTAAKERAPRQLRIGGLF